VEFGEVPAGRRLLEHAGCVRQLAAMFFLTMALRRLKPEMEWEEVVVFPINKSVVGPQIWRLLPVKFATELLFFRPSSAIMEMEGECGGMVICFKLLRLSMVLQVSKSAGAHSRRLVGGYWLPRRRLQWPNGGRSFFFCRQLFSIFLAGTRSSTSRPECHLGGLLGLGR
jgi:hypothetical protein